MKTQLTRVLYLTAASLCLLLALAADHAQASLLFWANNGTNTPTSGTWDLTSPNWSTNSALTNIPVVWDGVSAAAIPAGTNNISALTLTVNTTGIGFAGIFNSGVGNGGVTNLTISGTGSLNLVNAGVQEGFVTGTGMNTLLRVPVIGSGGIQWQGGGGSLFLSGANTYTAGTSLDTANGLNFNNGAAFGSSSGVITNTVSTTVLATPATDSANSPFATSAISVANPVQTYGGGSSTLIFVGIAAAPTTFTAPWTLENAAGTTFTLQNQPSGTTLTLSGAIGGAGNFTKTGAGTLVLSGANAYTGQTVVNNGVLSVNSINKVTGGNATSSLGAPTTVANGTIGLGSGSTSVTLIYTGAGETSDRVINLAGTTGGATIENDGSGAVVFSSALTSSGSGAKTLTLQGTSTAANTLSGAIVNSATGSNSVTKAQAGKWILSGANTYSGNTTVSAGTLAQGIANALSTKGNFAVSSGATFDLGGFNCTVNAFGTSAGTIDNTTGSGTYTFTIGSNNGGGTHSGVIKNTSGTLGITKIGTGATTLSGANTFSGKVLVSAGTLNVGSDGNLGAVPGSFTPDAVTLNGGTLGLTATAADINANRGITIGASGGNISASSGQSPSVESVITGSGVLTKSSAGNLNLNAANIFTAGLTITGGGVRFNNNQAAGTGTITVTPASIITLRQLNPPGPTSVTLTNPMILNANSGNDIDLAAATGNSLILSGPISGAGYFTRGRASGTGGTITLSGSNTFSGGLFLQGGTLALGSSNALGTGVLTIDPGPNNAAMLQSTTPLTGANAVTNVVTYIVTNTLMQATISGTTDLELAGPVSISNTAGSTVALTNNNTGATILSGVISGSGVGLLTTGSGTVTVRGNNTYSGGTTVAGGKLLVNNSTGSGTGSGAVTVSSGATLGGTGSIAGLVTVNAGATLSPGVTIGTLTLTVAPALAGTTAMDLNKAAGPVLTSDKLVVSPGGGTLTYGGALALTASGLAISNSDTFVLFGADSFSGSFSSITPATPGPGLVWDTSRLTVDGTIKAVCDGTLTANAGPNQTTCSGTGVTIGGSPTASGGSGSGYTYSWSPSTGLNDPTLANPTASPTSTTTYTVTVTDAAGCTAHASVTVSVDVPPSITAQPSNQTGCSGSSVTLSVSGAGSGLSYSWAKHSNAGWGSAWAVSGGGSTFRASSTDNDFGDTACTSFTSAFDINSPSGNALGMWGGFSGDEVATRSFAALTSSQTVSIDFDNGNVDTGSKVGFSLQTSGGADVLQFYFLGGQSNYKYNDGAEQDTGIPFQRTGLRVQFVLLSGTAFKLIVTPCGGTATTFTGTYSETIAQLKLFNQNTTGGNDKNIYFNNFLVGGYVDNADNYSGDYAGQDKGDQPIASGNGANSYTTPLLTVGDNGAQYEVVVDGCAGSVLSTAATVTVNPEPTASTGGNQTICAGTSTAGLGGVVGGGATGGTWSSSGTGAFVPNATTLNATYTPSAADITAGTVTLTLTTTGQLAPCTPATAQVVVSINPAPTANAGGNQTICAGSSTAGLGGSVGGSATSGTWSSSGTGTFAPNANTLNATYTPSAADVTAGSVTLTLTTTGQLAPCSPATAQVVVTINPAATASTGGNQTICAGNSTAGLGGSVGGGATGGTWSSSGTGSFVPNATALNASYTPSAADITAGVVTLTLTTTGQLAPCGAANAQVVVTINALPAITADPTNLAVCAGSPAIFEVSATGVGLTYQWQVSADGGTTFTNISDTATNASYTNLVTALADNGNEYQVIVSGACSPSVTSAPPAILTVNAPATASAGGNQTICAGTSTVGLGGSVGGGATGGTWSSSGTGTFVPNATALNATYTPSPADVAAGTVTLTLTSTGQLAPCSAATAQVVVTINPAPMASAGGNQTICAGSSTAGLGGVVGGAATGGTWSTSGTGSFAPNATALNATYTPSAADVAAGTVTLTLTTTGQLAPCGPATAQVIITINPAATASAGGNQTICAGTSTAGLGGSIGGGATGGTWSSSGTGSFVPNATALNATYTPSAADVAAGTVTLTLTTTGQLAPCSAATAQVVVTINPAATASAGGNQTICAGSDTVGLGGSVGGGATGGTWSSSGTGTFAPNATTLNATYSPSAADISAGTVTLTLTTSGQLAPCGPATAKVVVTINALPAITASPTNLAVCAGSPAIFQVSATGTDLTYQWQVSADGGATFTNISDTATNASYTNLVTTLAENDNEYQVIVSGACSPSVTSAPPAVLTVNTPATASAGGNQSICAGASTAGLGGSVGGGATGGTWSSSGTGTFVPNATTLNATYAPSPADIAAGTVTLTLTSTGQGAPCGVATAQVVVTINPAPVANAGADQTVCPNRPVMLGGSPTASGGTGPYTYSWAPPTGLSDPTVANPIAMIAGTTTYTVTVTDTNGCADSDSVVLTIPPQPEIQSITMSGTDVTLVWTSVPGLTYRVQYKTDLNAAGWADLAPDITATGATTTKIDSVGAATQRFYRISFVCP